MSNIHIREMDFVDLENVTRMIYLSLLDADPERFAAKKKSVIRYFAHDLGQIFENEVPYVLENGFDEIIKNHTFYVATADDKIVGCCGLQEIRYLGDNQDYFGFVRFEPRTLFVLPKYQYQGIGTELFNKVIKDSIKSGAEFVYIRSANRKREIKFYSKRGFKPVDVPWSSEEGYNMILSLKNTRS